MLSDFPTEIIEAILSHLEVQDLSRACRVSKRLHTCALPRLYRRIDIYGLDMEWDGWEIRDGPLRQALQQHPKAQATAQNARCFRVINTKKLPQLPSSQPQFPAHVRVAEGQGPWPALGPEITNLLRIFDDGILQEFQ
jgi:hypothetical protein